MNVTRRAPRLAVAAAVILTAAAPLPAQQELEMDQLRIPYRKFVLPNGLTLIVHEDHSVPIVGVNLWYHVGSRNEKRGRTGFAHLFEHFFFNGSENHPHGFREAMDDVGATNRNGTTNPDRTNFFEDVPVSALERTLYLEADRMGFLSGHLSQEMLERERGVVQNEKRQGENQPYGRVFNRIGEAIYPASHPYSWPTIGYMEDLQAATLDDVREWYRTYYGPNNCVLSLAGDITPEAALALVTKYFGPIPPGPPLPRLERWVPALDRNLRDSMEERAPQARVYRVWHAPPWGDDELSDLQVASMVLASGRSSRLVRRLVYEKELATAVAANVNEREVSGTFGVIVTVKAGVDPAEAEREMESVLAQFLAEGPSPEELHRARARIMSDFARGMERLGGFGGRSDVLAESMTYGGDPNAYLAQLERMTKATATQVHESSKRWLEAHHYTMVVTPLADLKPGEAAGLDRKVLPALGQPPEVKFPEVQRREMANGLKVMLLERHGVPLVNMALAVDAGSAADPPAALGTATLALALMQEGTRSRDAFQLSDAMDSLGAEIFTDNSLDLSFVRLRALRMNLPASVDLFAEVALSPAYREEMVQLGKRRQIARIGQEKAQPAGSAMRLLPRLLYGEGHAYAGPASGSGNEESVRSMRREDLAAWHETWFRPNNATLIVSGDVTMQDLWPVIEKAFSSWKRGRTPAKNVLDVAAGPARGPKVYLLDRPDAPQSVIVAAHVSEKGGQPDDVALDTVMRLFGGMATSRLNRNLRLDKHWSYGVVGGLTDARGQRPFTVVAPVQTDRTRESILELVREIKGIAGERPVAGEEFESLKRGSVARLPGTFETLGALERAAEDMVSHGRPPEYFYNYSRSVRELGPDALAAAAARAVHPDRITWLIVGDLKKVEAGIRELNLGEVAHLDPDGKPASK